MKNIKPDIEKETEFSTRRCLAIGSVLLALSYLFWFLVIIGALAILKGHRLPLNFL